VIRRLWNAVVGLVQRPEPTQDELELEAERQRAKDKWLEDEGRQSRMSAGTGSGV
jgi:hypothetical protein